MRPRFKNNERLPLAQRRQYESISILVGSVARFPKEWPCKLYRVGNLQFAGELLQLPSMSALILTSDHQDPVFLVFERFLPSAEKNAQAFLRMETPQIK